MPLTRLADWQERLTDFLRERREMPFIKGKNDCFLFAADAVLAMTGTDLVSMWRGKYESPLQAFRLISKYSKGGNLIDAMRLRAAEFGIEEIKPASSMLGDVCAVWGVGGPGICVVLASGTALHMQATGMFEFPTSQSDAAWRI